MKRVGASQAAAAPRGPDGRGAQRRLRHSWGATLVEYVLLLAVFAAGSVGAATYLTRGARTQIGNQADCLSTRPPPANCQIPAVVTTTSTSIGPTTSSSSTTTPPNGTVAWDTANSRWDHVARTATVRLQVRTAGGAPVPDATITLRFTVTPGNQGFYATCISNASGTCTTVWNVPFTDTTQIRVDAVSVSSPTPVTLPTTPLTLT